MAESITRKNIDLDILDYYDGKIKNYVDDKVGTGGLTIDDTLSDTSTNPVQNKVVKQAIDNKADKTVATIDTDGLMSAEDKDKLDNADDTYALKSLYGDSTINVGRKPGTDVGEYSTAEGDYTTASGEYSHAGGYHTEALNRAEFSHGEYNQSNADTLFSIGDGTADDARHNAFEITTDGGKLHDKDIATTDLIPTELPANGGNADYASNADYATNAGNADKLGGVVDAYHLGVYASDGYAYDASYGTDFQLHCRHHIFGDGRYGLRVGNGSVGVRVDYATDAQKAEDADTVDGRHAYRIPTLDANANLYDAKAENTNDAYLQWDGTRYFKLRTFGGNLTAVDYATNAGNADTVDDIHIHCANDGTSGLSWFAVFAATNDIRAVDPARAYVGSSGGVTCSLIGTASGCQYSTILAWANAQATATFASIVAATGFPSDAPYQQEALLQVQVDYYHQRKIVTWTRYLGGQAPQIRQRAIFGEAWNDDDWRVVCG